MLQFSLSLKQTMYVYVFLLDSSGELACLFPAVNTRQTNPFQAGKHVIPRGDEMWYLDHNTGDETFILIADDKPNSKIEELIGILAKGNADATKVYDSLRGVGGIKKAGAAISKDTISELLIDNSVSFFSQTVKHN